MVLIEAMASGTPPVASAIAGYSDVVTDGVDGVLVPPADPQALGEELLALWHEPERRAAMGEAGRESAQRYAWPRVADEVSEVYERAAQPLTVPADPIEAAARRAGLLPHRRRAPAPREANPVARARCRRRAAAAAASPAASASASPASSASASPTSPRARSASTRSPTASSAATSPGCWSPSR